MREIKFRGKRIDTGEWVYGFYTKIAVNFGQNDVIMEQTKGGSFVPQFIDIKTLGQFIGIPDKNGKEIYEGDITRHHYHDLTVKWVWGDRIVQFYGVERDGAEKYYFGFDSKYLEVIGNIHDNPELLEVEK